MGREGEEATEDETVGWHHQLNGHEFEQPLGDSEGQGSLACCSPWGHRESDTTERHNNSDKRKETEAWSSPGVVARVGQPSLDRDIYDPQKDLDCEVIPSGVLRTLANFRQLGSGILSSAQVSSVGGL